VLPFFIKQREWGGVGTGSVVESILTLICSSYLNLFKYVKKLGLPYITKIYEKFKK